MPRPSLGLALAAILALAPGGALAQDYPARQIHFLQGFAPGGNADAIARVLGDELSKAVGQPVVVESRAGAGGNLAADATAKAAPDGHTLLLMTTAHVISAALYRSLPFDPINDFAFITTVSELPHFIVVNAAKSPHKTLAELVAAAKPSPAESISAPPASVPDSISRASCSMPPSAPRWCMCPIAATPGR